MNIATMSRDQLIGLAKDVLRNTAALEPAAQLDLADSLKNCQEYKWARRLYEQLMALDGFDAAARLALTQKLASATYSDSSLPAGERLDAAFNQLQSADPPETSTNPKTLRLLGAICKRRWDLYAQRTHLEDALAYYERGSRFDEPARASNAINAAFVLDVLAAELGRSGAVATENMQLADTYRERATSIRRGIIGKLEPLAQSSSNWWLIATLVEAHFGNEDFARAEEYAKTAAKSANAVPAFQQESVARQLGELYRVRYGTDFNVDHLRETAAGRVILALVGERAQGLRAAFAGKLGIALSGGGHRAALFHIGVLARLAELDLLRNVEAISCVSGGSIVGALYYLKLRKLLTLKADSEVTRQDYLDLVQSLEKDFVEAVRMNLRMRLLLNPLRVARMLFTHYTRTERSGELLERYFYRRSMLNNDAVPLELSNLFVRPEGKPGFNPKNDNWGRSAKVPMLIVNASTLNTGHNWQFTASWMGEPGVDLQPQFDANPRLRRMYYGEAPDGYKSLPLGRAVAASAAVPGIFAPIRLNKLYPDMNVLLSDGGVHDNQGISSLLEQNCNAVIVSDASGQMGEQSRMMMLAPQVMLRANDVLMSRVRSEQWSGLDARKRAGALRSLGFLHLKKGLDSPDVSWIKCDEPEEVHKTAEHTGYGVRVELQRAISAIRTDLDFFSDIEAHSLMASGYLMAKSEITDQFRQLSADAPARGDWQFAAAIPVLTAQEENVEVQRYARVLRAASKRLGRLPALGTSEAIAWVVLWALVVAVAVLAGSAVVQVARPLGGWRWVLLAAIAIPLLPSYIALASLKVQDAALGWFGRVKVKVTAAVQPAH